MVDERNDVDQVLRDIYYSPPRPPSFGGKRKLVYSAPPGVSKSDINRWLRSQDAYTLHHPIRTKFPRRKTIVAGIGEQLQADLVDVRSHKDRNDGVTFLLTCVDVFSRKAWVFPLQNKTGLAVSRALSSLFERETFSRLQTDKGKEFLNQRVREVLRENKVEHFSSENEVIKASLVERFNQTLRGKVHRLLTYRGDGRFIDELDDLVRSYNDSFNRSIGMTPNEVDEDNQEDIWIRLYESSPERWVKKKRAAFSPGQHVRISMARGSFDRGFTANYSTEIFIIKNVLSHTSPITYSLKDLNEEDVEGTFYRQELVRVDLPETFKVEKVLRRRKRRGKEESFVKWLGYPNSFNSWIDSSQFV